jgi:hypothetical protein
MSRLVSTKDILEQTTVAGSTSSYNTSGASGFSAQCVVTGSSPVGTIGLQKSNDGVNWSTEATATAISGAATFFFERIDPVAKYYRVTVTVTSGTVLVDHHILVKSLT